ncbi:MAG: UDP-N-acetylmuramate--alanine ligase [Lautropia sp.]
MFSDARSERRAEIAALAAQLIADGGLDYQSAKRKAARQLFGDGLAARQMPDNDEIDRSLLEYLQLFDPDHAARVERYRAAALLWMERLAAFRPYLTGAAWKGIVAPHAPLHLQVFTDDAKELEMLLLDAGVAYDVAEVAHFGGRADVPALTFYDREDLPVMISIYRFDDLRGALKRSGGGSGGTERGGVEALRRLLGAAPEAAGPPAR